MNIKVAVRDVILSFEEKFTLSDVLEVLRDKKILNDNNKAEVMKEIDSQFEGPWVCHVPFSDSYYILGSKADKAFK